MKREGDDFFLPPEALGLAAEDPGFRSRFRNRLALEPRARRRDRTPLFVAAAGIAAFALWLLGPSALLADALARVRELGLPDAGLLALAGAGVAAIVVALPELSELEG